MPWPSRRWPAREHGSRPRRPSRSLEESGWISSIALVIDRELPIEKFEALGGLIGKVGSAAKFWAGDYLLYAEAVYGEEGAQASESLNLSEAGGKTACGWLSLSRAASVVLA